ncbi:MAG: hypothetical protein ACYDAD_00170 [Acidimicrobiales bacterium]
MVDSSRYLIASDLHKMADHWVTEAIALAAKRRAGRLSDQELELRVQDLCRQLTAQARALLAGLSSGHAYRPGRTPQRGPIEVRGELAWIGGADGLARLRAQGEAIRAIIELATEGGRGDEHGQ